jgi:hypothetical protein
VFGGAERLGENARNYTMAGYLAADTELNVWRSKCQEWRTASNALSELGRMWWSNKHMQWPGLTVYGSPCTHSLALV